MNLFLLQPQILFLPHFFCLVHYKENLTAHYNLGLLYLEQERMNEAEDQFAKAIALDSTDVDAVREYNLLKEENQ